MCSSGTTMAPVLAFLSIPLLVIGVPSGRLSSPPLWRGPPLCRDTRAHRCRHTPSMAWGVHSQYKSLSPDTRAHTHHNRCIHLDRCTACDPCLGQNECTPQGRRVCMPDP